MKELVITFREEGQRLDRFLEKYLKEGNRNFIYRMLRKKNITLNGRKAQGNEKLSDGDILRLYFAQETLTRLRGDQENRKDIKENPSWPVRELKISYENGDVIMINKPAGMLSQKAAPGDVSLCEYLIGFLLATGRMDREDLQTFRPSVCNRLDYSTSGIVCCGKTMRGLQGLSECFSHRQMQKFYQCLVFGTVTKEALLEGEIVKNGETNRSVVYAAPSGEGAFRSAGRTGSFAGASLAEKSAGKQAVTRIRPLQWGKISLGETYVPVTYLEAQLLTGRSHQIRAQLSAAGHPLLGDLKYAGTKGQRQVNQRLHLRGQLLHCARVVFPQRDCPLPELAGVEVTAPAPSIFEKIRAAIE